MPFNKKYHVIENAPSQLDWEEYCSKSLMEYQLILKNCSDDETVFQKFSTCAVEFRSHFLKSGT